MRGQEALFSADSGEWRTPLPLFDKLNEEFGFTFDAAATSENALVRDWTANALNDACEWGACAYCNPPYGDGVDRWLEKAYHEAEGGSTVVMLLPARTDTRWWHRYVMRADEVRFIPGRIKFEHPSKVVNSAPFPSCIVVFRPLPSARRHGGPRMMAWSYRG